MGEKPWKGAVERLRQTTTLSVFTDLANATINVENISLANKEASQVSNNNILTDAKFAITGKVDKNKGHQVPKSPTCQPFHGPIVECVVGSKFS